MPHRHLFAGLLTALALLAAPTHAQSLPPSLTTYFGQDTAGAPYTSIPAGGNAATARTAFDGNIRLGSVGLESFEGTTYGSQTISVNNTHFQTLDVTFAGSGNSQSTREDVTATFTGAAASQFQIRDDRKNGAFATAGSQFLGSDESGIDITFDTPVAAFGFYGTDFGEAGTTEITLTLTDTDNNTYSFTQDLVVDQTGNVMFVGFTDQENQYDRVQISADNDAEYFGFDSFIIADVNQVTGIEFASISGSAVEGETVRLLLRLDEVAFPAGGSVDVVLLPPSGAGATAADLDGYTTQTVAIAPGDNLVAVPIRITSDDVADDGETFTFGLLGGTGGFASRNGEAFTLTVGDPLPQFSQSFTPSLATNNVPTTYTLVVDNTGRGTSASGITASATLPSGLTVASPSNEGGTCGGVISASGQTISFSGGSIGPDATCTVTADVIASVAGTYTLPPSFVQTSRGSAPLDGLSLTVDANTQISFDAATAARAEDQTLTIGATLSAPAPSGGFTVDVVLTGDAADLSASAAPAGTAYTTQTLTFAQGATTASLDVDVTADGLAEPEETFTFGFADFSSGLVAGSTDELTLTVAASDPTVAVGVGTDQTLSGTGTEVLVSAEEGGTATLTVTLTDGARGGETVDVVLTGDADDVSTSSSPQGTAYATQTLTFATGETTASLSIDLTADGLAEPEETVRLALANAVGLDLGAPGALDVTIAESDPTASVTAGAGQTVSGAGTEILAALEEDGSTTLTVTLTDDARGGETVDVLLVPAASTGTADDLGPYVGTLTFATGETTASVTIPALADGLAEPAETLRLALANADGLDLGTTAAFDLTIAESYATAAFATASAEAQEGDVVTVTVSLTGPAEGDEALDVVLTSGDPVDLDGFTSQTLTFRAGETSTSFDLTVSRDEIADPSEAFTFELRSPTDLDLGTQTTFDLAVGLTGSFISFGTVQTSTTEGAGSVGLPITISHALVSPGRVTIQHVATAGSSADATDIGGFTEVTVELPAGPEAPREIAVEIPITDDAIAEGAETFAFQIVSVEGNEDEGLAFGDPALISLVITDNDGGSGGGGGGGGGSTGSTTTATLPFVDADGDGVEDGGVRFLSVPVSGVTAGELAAAAGPDGGPAPTVYVVDPATGALVPASDDLVLSAGQPVYLDVAPGAALSLTGTAPTGPVTYPAATTAASDGRVTVAVGNPTGLPIRLSDLRVEGGTLADAVLVLDPATGAFVPVSLAALLDGTDIVGPYGTVVVQVIPSGDPGDVAVSFDPADADDTLDPAASGLLADACEAIGTDEVVVCLELGYETDGLDAGDRAVVRLRPAADGVFGIGMPMDDYDGLDLASPSAYALSIPDGTDADLPLAVASTPFAADSVLTIPLDVQVDGTGSYLLALARDVAPFENEDLDLFLIDGTTVTPFAFGAPYAFQAEAGDDLSGRFALRIGEPKSAVATESPVGADRVSVPFPNPAPGASSITVEVASAQALRVTLVDALGREVLVAFDGEAQGGTALRIPLDGSRLARGVYVVRVAGETVREARRLTIAR